MRDPLQDFKGDTYDRPNQPWICGLSEEGQVCPSGPGRRGRCPGASACHPLRDGDRWVCNRSPARGGACENGPTSDGQCCQTHQCTPLRSLRVRRGRFVLGCVVATLGGMLLMLSSDSRNNFLAPGALTTAHAQLLSRDSSTNRCANCHAAGDQSFFDWTAHAVNAELASPSQSKLCLECHKNTIDTSVALAAHTMDASDLVADSDATSSRRIDPTQALACSTCHREHHGAEHDLTWMSDQSCQACHQQQYHSFATDHPDFENWPSARRTRIAFDHGAHQLKHFPKEKQEFACASCHRTDRDGSSQLTLGYDAACAKCHDKKITDSWDAGIAMFSLPMIDREALQAAGHNVGQWPAQAIDEFDGALPPVTKILLLADNMAVAALRELGGDFDFFDIDPDDPKQLQAAANVVAATQRLLNDLSVQGQQEIRRRLESVLARELAQDEFSNLTSRLSPENLAVITSQWLTNADGAALVPATDRASAQARVAAGGWFGDETTLSVRYRPTGHADPWVTAWTRVLAEATTGRNAAITKPLLRQMMSPTSAGQCGTCHSLDRLDDGTWTVQWFGKRPATGGRPFTKFSHGPHLTLSKLADCQGCHQIDPQAEVMATYASTDPTVFENGFQPHSRESCAECHTPQGAGDSCIQCHNYHVRPN